MQDRLGRWYQGVEDRPDLGLASQTVTVSGVSAALTAEDVINILATLAVTAASGTTPTLDVRLETSADDGVTWYTCASFAQLTAVGSSARVFGPIGQKVRFAWTVGGTTPSFTFAITAKANRDD